MSTFAKYFVLIIALLLLAVAGGAWYSLSRMEVSTLAICSEGEGGILIPADACFFYLKNFRLGPEDIDSLEREGGLEVVLNGNTERKYRIAELLIDNGLDVDSPNAYSDTRLTPLQSAVLYSDLERVRFLVEHGAAILEPNPTTGSNALELARRMAKNKPSPEAHDIVNYLEQ